MRSWRRERRGRFALRGPARWAVLIFAALLLALEIYTLFFALSAKEAYTCQRQARPVCKSGVYALCRHPGVLWFAGLYLCLWAAAGLALRAAVFFSVLDVLLVLFEDRCVFPARLDGYDDYRAETPFLLPNRQSIRACCGRSEQRGARIHASGWQNKVIRPRTAVAGILRLCRYNPC